MMKIAVPTRGEKIDDHFGQCNFFSVYEIIDGKIESKTQMDSPQGCGCKSNLTQLLNEQGVTKMLAGNMGDGALNKLTNAGIEVIRGCKGNPDEVMKAYLAGFLIDSGIGCESHLHHHEHGHNHEHSCNH
ncbi:NifB/NifX family molybdenum-iron cluster-binding protein [Saccharicrinis sp. FJH62]|uniref:NifB/NifX family molybdenum-iron cluster-binding protein n=1 Tax=Saccharicrinis sp. FJH62 TaxID=3344657 RepID=UPI0035D3ECE7